jgi:hypothetical protein
MVAMLPHELLVTLADLAAKTWRSVNKAITIGQVTAKVRPFATRLIRYPIKQL